MPIRIAADIDFTVPPRCPEPGCGVGILPYGRNEPLVVDEQGRVYCRAHGERHDRDYPARVAAYRDERARARVSAAARLAEGDDPAAAEE